MGLPGAVPVAGHSPHSQLWIQVGWQREGWPCALPFSGVAASVRNPHQRLRDGRMGRLGPSTFRSRDRATSSGGSSGFSASGLRPGLFAGTKPVPGPRFSRQPVIPARRGAGGGSSASSSAPVQRRRRPSPYPTQRPSLSTARAWSSKATRKSKAGACSRTTQWIKSDILSYSPLQTSVHWDQSGGKEVVHARPKTDRTTTAKRIFKKRKGVIK